MDKNAIIEHEDKLRNAMLSSNIELLDELIDDDLIFVNHFGQILTKEMDIEAHRSGMLNFSDIKVLDQKSRLLNQLAITVTRVSLKGTVGSNLIEDEMCYTRVWQETEGKIKIISGHCSTTR